MLEQKVANALAEGIVPANAPGRAAMVAQLGGILMTPQGHKLWFEGVSGFDPQLANETKNEVKQLIIERKITAVDLLQTEDPWENPVLLKAIVANRMDGVAMTMAVVAKTLNLGVIKVDEPIKFTNREDLIFFVVATSNLPPDRVKAIVDKLFPLGASEAIVSFRPVFYASDSTGVVQFPLYGKHDLSSIGGLTVSEATLVDNTAREYKAEPRKRSVLEVWERTTEPPPTALEEWKKTTNMPPGMMIYPQGGRIVRDKTGDVVFEVDKTPAGSDGAKAEKAAAVTLMIGGMFAGGLTLLGVRVGTWAIKLNWLASLNGVRNAISGLKDRSVHGESNSWSNPEARALKLGGIASGTNLFSLGVSASLQDTMYARQLTQEMALLQGVANTAMAVTDGAAFVNEVADLIQNYEHMSSEDIFIALTQLGWHGVMSGMGIHQAGGLGAALNPMAQARALLAKCSPLPSVHSSDKVLGNAVEIRLVDGRRYEVFVGPGVNRRVPADAQRIAYHVELAHEMNTDITFGDLLLRSLGRKSDSEMASIVADINKTNAWIAQQKAKLEHPALLHEDPDAIRKDIAVCEQYVEELRARQAELAKNPSLDRGAKPIQLPDSTGGARNVHIPKPEEFIGWLGKKYPNILETAEKALKEHGLNIDRMDQGEAHPYRNQLTSSGGPSADAAVDNIVACIVQSEKKGWLGNLFVKGKYREIYENYVDLIEARSKELDRLRDKDGIRSSFMKEPTQIENPLPAEQKFVIWLIKQHPEVISDLASASTSKYPTNPYNVVNRGTTIENMVRWLIQSKKYQLGINSEYNDIFAKYIELNAARLREMRDLESELPPAKEPDEIVSGGVKATSRKPLVIMSIPSARGFRYLNSDNTKSVVNSIGNLLPRNAAKTRLLEAVKNWIENEPGTTLTVEHFIDVVNERALQQSGFAGQSTKNHFDITGDPHVVSSIQQSPNGSDVMQRSDVINALNDLLTPAN